MEKTVHFTTIFHPIAMHFTFSQLESYELQPESYELRTTKL